MREILGRIEELNVGVIRGIEDMGFLVHKAEQEREDARKKEMEWGFELQRMNGIQETDMKRNTTRGSS